MFKLEKYLAFKTFFWAFKAFSELFDKATFLEFYIFELFWKKVKTVIELDSKYSGLEYDDLSNIAILNIKFLELHKIFLIFMIFHITGKSLYTSNSIRLSMDDLIWTESECEVSSSNTKLEIFRLLECINSVHTYTHNYTRNQQQINLMWGLIQKKNYSMFLQL